MMELLAKAAFETNRNWVGQLPACSIADFSTPRRVDIRYPIDPGGGGGDGSGT